MKSCVTVVSLALLSMLCGCAEPFVKVDGHVLRPGKCITIEDVQVCNSTPPPAEVSVLQNPLAIGSGLGAPW